MIMLNHNLHIFLSVAEKGNITETAKELYISQPAVSKAVKNLEDELNLKLFHRDKRKGLILTEVGSRILLIARQMADMENRMYQTAFRSNNFIGGKVKVASMPIVTTVILAKVFAEFKRKYPFVEVELMETSAAGIKKAVEEHQVDFGITSSPFGKLDFEVLFKDEMIAVSKNKLNGSGVISFADISEPLIFCKSGLEIISENLKNPPANTSKSFVVEQAGTVIALANENNGIGIVSRLVADTTPNSLNRYSILPEIQTDMGIAAHNINDLTPVAAELKRMIVEKADVIK